MLKVAVVGDRESVSGFKAIGMDVFIPDDCENCREYMKKLCSGDYAIIYITEEYAVFCKDIIKKYADKLYPAVILIPGVKNNTGEGMDLLFERVKKAVGSELPE